MKEELRLLIEEEEVGSAVVGLLCYLLFDGSSDL